MQPQVGGLSAEDARAARVRPLLFSTAVAVIGQGAFVVACPLAIASVTQNPLTVAFAAVALYVPWLLVGLPAGALVDRWPRRPVMISADLGRAAVIALLAVVIIGERLPIWLVFAALFLVTVGQCFFDSAAQATIPAIIGRDQQRLDVINGRFWTLDNVGRAFLGPLIGAAAFSWWNAAPFVLASAAFLVSAALVSRLPRVDGARGKTTSFVTTMREGLIFFRNSRCLRLISYATAIYNVGINLATATLVLFSSQTLQLNSAGYGLLVAAMAVGAIVGGWKIAGSISRTPASVIIAGTLVLQGVSWAVVAVLPILPVVLVALASVGVATVLITVACTGQLQRAVPDAMMGRATAVYRVIAIGAGGLGAVASGAVADAGGLNAGPISAATMLIVIGGAALAVVARHRSVAE